ncbi:hypothetical protein KQX54_010675 [Cotesia glomerata]|uniref:Uncharacterized protein n=1 Tax=Cotesia glomerata TaxID=32391 RepID=A0AAV7J2J2_COTGL|nr:hypothetical protein KQX54_010675 [Cotesia glomerata]
MIIEHYEVECQRRRHVVSVGVCIAEKGCLSGLPEEEAIALSARGQGNEAKRTETKRALDVGPGHIVKTRHTICVHVVDRLGRQSITLNTHRRLGKQIQQVG